MTAKELYETSSELRGFLSVWVADRRCPFPLADLFLDYGMESQADCAKWCANQPDREVHYPLMGETRTPCGTYLTHSNRGTWYFELECLLEHASRVPLPERDSRFIDVVSEGDSPLEAILDLLDAWKIKETSDDQTY